jgi:hypothetical protein
MTTFTAQLKAFADKTKAQLDDVVGNVVVGMAESILLRSPVGNPDLWKSPAPKGYIGGHFRANWQLGLGEWPTATISGIDDSPGGGETLNRIRARIPADAAGKVYYIANLLPYANALEYGHSTQAPQGMVGLTVVQFDSIVTAAVQDTKS